MDRRNAIQNCYNTFEEMSENMVILGSTSQDIRKIHFSHIVVICNVKRYVTGLFVWYKNISLKGR